MEPIRCTGCSSFPVEGSGISEQPKAHNGGGHIAPSAALRRVMENMGVNCMTQTASPTGGGIGYFRLMISATIQVANTVNIVFLFKVKNAS